MVRFGNSLLDGRKHALTVAMHITLDTELWMQNIEFAHAEGADGIFIIRDYETPTTNEDALGAYHWTRNQYKYQNWWVGLNMLGWKPHEVVTKVDDKVSGLWFDEPYIDEDREDGASYFDSVAETSSILHLPLPPLLVPCVAMKYRPQPKDLTKVVKMIERSADVIATSGEETGKAPDIEKIKKLRAATEKPIGLCSGVDAQNVNQFVGAGVNLFIIWTGLATDGKLDKEKFCRIRDSIPR